MGRSHRKHCKMPICSVGTEGMRKWKKNCRQERRAKEKAQMNGITQDEEGYDEETCTPVKYQKDKNMTDWSGPHDGWWRGDPKEIAEDLYDGKIWKAEDK